MTEPDRRAAGRFALPAVTLALVACAVAIERWPAAMTWLRFERAAIVSGEVWRLLTGHLVHGETRLAVLDLTAFALFGVWVERTSRQLYGWVLAASALVSSLVVLVFTDFERYVGSSALASGMLTACAVLVLRSRPGRAARLVALSLLGLLSCKVALELLGRWPASLSALPPGYESVAVAHLGGALAGGVAALRVRDPG